MEIGQIVIVFAYQSDPSVTFPVLISNWIISDRIGLWIVSNPISYNDKHGTSPETPDLIKSLYDPTNPCQSPSPTRVGHKSSEQSGEQAEVLLGSLENLVLG